METKLFDELPASNKSVLKYNYYRKGDYEAMNEYLGSIGWSEILFSIIHDDWHVIKEIVQDTMAKYKQHNYSLMVQESFQGC